MQRNFERLLPLPLNWMRPSRVDRSLADRRRLLQAALTCLKTHAQRHGKTGLLEKIFEILDAARAEVTAHSRDRAWARDSPDHRDAERPTADRKRRQAILDELGKYAYHLAYPSIVSEEPEDPLVPFVRELQAKIQARPLPESFTFPEGRTNLSAITTQVRARLLDAGVPRSLPWFAMMKQRAGCKANVKNLHESLLMAVGLIPYRRK